MHHAMGRRGLTFRKRPIAVESPDAVAASLTILPKRAARKPPRTAGCLCRAAVRSSVNRSATSTHDVRAIDDFVTENHVADLASCRGGFSSLPNWRLRVRISSSAPRRVPGRRTLHASWSAPLQKDSAGISVTLLGREPSGPLRGRSAVSPGSPAFSGGSSATVVP